MDNSTCSGSLVVSGCQSDLFFRGSGDVNHVPGKLLVEFLNELNVPTSTDTEGHIGDSTLIDQFPPAQSVDGHH